MRRNILSALVTGLLLSGCLVAAAGQNQPAARKAEGQGHPSDPGSQGPAQGLSASAGRPVFSSRQPRLLRLPANSYRARGASDGERLVLEGFNDGQQLGDGHH